MTSVKEKGNVGEQGRQPLRTQHSFKKELARLIGSFQIKIASQRYPTSQGNRLS